MRSLLRTFGISLALAVIITVAVANAAPPKPYDITMMAGEDYWVSVKLSNNGTPINLTGDVAAAQFRSAPAPAGVVYATYSTVISPTTGEITAKLSRAQTVALTGKTGVWDLLRRSSAGLVSYILAGKVIVMPTATRLP